MDTHTVKDDGAVLDTLKQIMLQHQVRVCACVRARVCACVRLMDPVFVEIALQHQCAYVCACIYILVCVSVRPEGGLWFC